MYEGKRKENLMYGTGSAADRVLRAGNDRMGRGNGDTGKGCGRRDHNTGGSRPELRSIKLPAGLKSIDSFAFNDCSGLTEIEIPEAVWYIGECAFDSCDKLTGVKLPSKLTTIKYGAFYGCSRLTSMTIPAGVTDIESGAWQDCTAMNSLSVVEGNTSFFVKDNVLFNKDQSTLIYWPIGKSGAYQIPQGVTTISTGAFLNCRNLTGITLPEGLKIIGRSAFACCGGLTEMTISVGVTDIDEGAFAGCSSLTDIIVDEQNPNYSSVDGVLFDKTGTKLMLCPAGKKGDYQIPDGVKNIKSRAFAGCDGLTKVTIPSGVTGIGGSVFEGCTNLEIECDENSYAYSYVKKNNLPTQKTFTITFSAEGGTGLSQSSRAVKEDEALGTLPTVTRTGYIFKGWFAEKTGGTAVTKDTKAVSNLTVYAQWEKVIQPIDQAEVTLSAGRTAYDGKAKKPSVISVKLAGKFLTARTDYTIIYNGNTNIGTASVIVTGTGNYTGTVTKTFTIYAKKGTTVTSGAYRYKFTGNSEVAFAGIKSAKTKKVTIPKTVKIGGKIFKVTSIAKKALFNRSKVTSVTIGENVKTIGASASGKCKKLFTITIRTTKLKSVGKNALNGVRADAKIRVPSRKLKAYRKILKNRGQGCKVTIVKQ